MGGLTYDWGMNRTVSIKITLVMGTVVFGLMGAMAILFFGFSAYLFEDPNAKYQAGTWILYGANLCLPLLCATGIMMAWLKHKRQPTLWDPLGWLLFPLVSFGFILVAKVLRIYGL